jgi:hypothetical protein
MLSVAQLVGATVRLWVTVARDLYPAAAAPSTPATAVRTSAWHASGARQHPSALPRSSPRRASRSARTRRWSSRHLSITVAQSPSLPITYGLPHAVTQSTRTNSPRSLAQAIKAPSRRMLTATARPRSMPGPLLALLGGPPPDRRHSDSVGTSI